MTREQEVNLSVGDVIWSSNQKPYTITKITTCFLFIEPKCNWSSWLEKVYLKMFSVSELDAWEMERETTIKNIVQLQNKLDNETFHLNVTIANKIAELSKEVSA